MKNTASLAIFDLLFVAFAVIFFYTQSSIYAFLAFPFYIGTGFSQYFRQKRRLPVVTDDIVKLLKLENIIYWFAMLVLFVLIYYINIPPVPFDRMYFVVIIFILFFSTFFISGKRRNLINEEVNK